MTPLAKRRTDGSIGLMGHVIADYPSPAAVRAMIAAMAARGVEVIEVQIPFSEPMADGPVFLAANHAALAQGVDYAASLALMREATAAHPGTRFVFMSYLNPLYKRGYERFAADAADAGAKGVIVPDLPVELAGKLDDALQARGLVDVRLVPPNVTDERLAALAARAEGFVYAVARRGVTGAPTEVGDDVAALVRRIRTVTALPVAVGFGVRRPDDVRALKGVADLAIVGTASLAAFQEGGLTAFERFWDGLAEAALQ